MNRYFIVDYENVPQQGLCLNGIEYLTEKDTVYILFAHEETGISFPVMEKIRASKAKIFQKHIISDTDNAVQYTIGFYIGLAAGKQKSDNYAVAVISDETFGFLPELENINLYASQSIAKAAAVMPQPSEEKSEQSDWDIRFSEIMESLNIRGGFESELHKTIKRARETADSIAAQTKINDLFGGLPQEIADSVYHALKPLLDPNEESTHETKKEDVIITSTDETDENHDENHNSGGTET